MDFSGLTSQLHWSDSEVSVEEIASLYSLPQIIKSTAKTSTDYDLSENAVVLLLMRQQLLRVTAHEIGETCYVFGDAFEISSTFEGRFKLCTEPERDEDIVKIFKFISEIANTPLSKFYLLEQISVSLPSTDRAGSFSIIDFFEGEEFTVNHHHHDENVEPASRKLSSSLNSSPSHHSTLSVHCTRLDKDLKLPHTLKAAFASRPPKLLSYPNLSEEQTFSIQDFLQFGNFPLTVVLKSLENSSLPSGLRNRRLHCGMRMKLTGLEVHTAFLAVGSSCQVVEFSNDATFFLPSSLSDPLQSREELCSNAYWNCVKKLISDLNLNQDVSLIEAYCKSTRDHTRRRKTSADRQQISAIAYLRQLNMNLYCFNAKSLMTSLVLPNGSSDEEPNENSLTKSRDSSVSDDSDGSMWGEYTPLCASQPTSPKTEERNRNSRSMTAFENPLRSTPELSFEMEQSVSNYYANHVIKPDSFSIADPRSDAEMSTPRSASDVIDGSRHRRGMRKQSISDCDRTIPKQIFKSVDDCTTSEQLRESDLKSNYDRVPPQSAPPFSSRSAYPYVVKLSDKSMPRNEKFKVYVVGGKDSDITIKIYSSSSHRSSSDDLVRPESSRKSFLETNKPSFRSGNTDSENDLSNASKNPKETKPKRIYTLGSSFRGDENASISISRHNSQRESEVFGKATFLNPPTGWLPSAEVSSMNVAEVANSLRYIGINEEVVTIFQQERIDGNLLLKLPDEILEQECRFNPLQLFKLKAFFEGWRPKLN